jgi:hypothetical protein
MVKTLFVSVLALAGVLAAPSNTVDLPPSKDPWYKAPPNFASKKPGDILRVRSAPENIRSSVNASAAYNILYRTTNSFNAPAWAVTTYFVPDSHKTHGTEGKPALLSYQIPYDSVNVDFSPSYALPTSYSSALGDIAGSLARGLYVSVPDYEGPTGAFTVGVLAGHSVLDSIRATLSTGKGLDCESSALLWGYSGGSQASEFAAELHPKYAPELKLKGAALGGLVGNILAILQNINATPLAGLTPNALLGLSEEYSEVSKYLNSRLNPSGPQNATTFLAAKQNSFVQSIQEFGGQDIYGYFKGGKADIMNSQIMLNAFNKEGIMGVHGVPTVPLFFYTAINDEASPINTTQALMDKYCAAGANILWEKNTVGGHLAEQTNGDANAVAWLTDILNGSTKQEDDCEPKGCIIKEVTLNITSSPI